MKRRTFSYPREEPDCSCGPEVDFTELQYIQGPEVRVPWRAVVLAAVLLFLGGTLMFISICALTGVLTMTHSDRMWAILLLGVLMFVPGAYHIRIAYHAFKGDPNYSFDDIPDFD